MCGITGFISENEHIDSLKESVSALHHRGPDGHAHIHIPNMSGVSVGLGHTRLRIIDIGESADQPFTTSDRNTTLIFNGEIYNFEELRSLLPNQNWLTSSDTEVLAELLNKYGTKILNKINGIYAFAAIDRRSERVVLARDPLGVKPLYVSKNPDENGFYFASEIAALLPYGIVPLVSLDDLFESLNFGYVHEPNTGFSNIKKIAPGEILEIDCKIALSTFSSEIEPNFTSKLSDSELIRTAVNAQTISDVPLGTFFSGGIDSTAVASVANTSCLYINNKIGSVNSEFEAAKKISEHLNLSLIVSPLNRVDTNEKLGTQIAQIARRVEEPISDFTFAASQDLSKTARTNGFTVMLSGMGGDEIFCGYPRYKMLRNINLYTPVAILLSTIIQLTPVRLFFAHSTKIERFFNFFKEKSFIFAYARLVGYLSAQEITGLVGGDQNHKVFAENMQTRLERYLPKQANTPLAKAMKLDAKGFLSHNLTVVDKSSMLESIEVRVPLLDLSIVHRWQSYSSKQLKEMGWGKRPLLTIIRESLGFDFDFGKKVGFNPPLEELLGSLPRSQIKSEILSKKFLKYLNQEPVLQVIDDHFSGKKNNINKIWQLMFISKWLEVWG